MKSKLLKEEKEIKSPDYSDKERKYISALQSKLESAKKLRDQPLKEFDHLTLAQYWRENEKFANTEIQPKKNRSDTTYKSGTLRQKMMAFLSSLVNLNLSPDVSCYNKKDLRINALSQAIEDTLWKADYLEEGKGKEKRMLRQYELLKHGTVFIEEVWDERKVVKKDLKKKFNGKIINTKWTERTEKTKGMPKRNILPLPCVYLGSMREYFMKNQPYIFTVETMDYSKAKQMFGDWDRFKYVTKTRKNFSGESGMQMVENSWRLKTRKEGQVEIIRYQNKPDQEYQIVLNGIPMLPMGYPFPWGHKEYNVIQQNLEPIRNDFAYGKSFIFKNKNLTELLDEMMKMAMLKTQKSYFPPYFNNSGKAISQKMLQPGVITPGFSQGDLVPASEHETKGVTSSEFNMIQEVKRTVDENTASNTFTGAKEQGDRVTATQIQALQQQAKMMLGIIILSAALLEEKLASIRILNLLENWFAPSTQAAGNVAAKQITRYTNIEGEGEGVRIVYPTDSLPDKRVLRQTEDLMEDQLGIPVRVTAIKPKDLQNAKYIWYVKVTPQEEKTSRKSKSMFRLMVNDALSLGLPLSKRFLMERFAQVWEENVDKMFSERKEQAVPKQAEEGKRNKEGLPSMQDQIKSEALPNEQQVE